MAIEFGSRKETFDNFKVYETMLAGRPFKVEMGKMCGLSNASALIRYGETCVMCNVVMSPKPREGVDFFPLNVEYEEKLYAAGRIPGSFMRREGRVEKSRGAGEWERIERNTTYAVNKTENGHF